MMSTHQSQKELSPALYIDLGQTSPLQGTIPETCPPLFCSIEGHYPASLPSVTLMYITIKEHIDASRDKANYTDAAWCFSRCHLDSNIVH